MKLKKFLSLLLSAAMAFSLLTATAFAAAPAEEENGFFDFLLGEKYTYLYCECYWRSGAGGWFSSGCCRCRHCYGSSTSRQRNLCNRNAAEEGAALQNPSL